MAHSKQFMIDEIKRFVEEMQLALTHINTPENHLVIPDEAVNAPVEVIREGYKWLVTVFETRHDKWVKVRALLTEEQWKRYYLWGGFDNHREMVMLKEASLHLRQAVIARARPDLFKKSKLNVILKKQEKKRKASQRTKAGKPKKQPKASQRTKAASVDAVGAGDADQQAGEG